MKVKDLLEKLAGVSGDLDIVVRAWDDGESDYCGTIGSVKLEHSHDEDNTPFIAIDCGPEDQFEATGDDTSEVD